MIDPAIQLANGFLGVTLVAGKKVGLCQTDDVRMAVQLMYDFWIAGGGILHEVVVRPESARPQLPCQRISMPIDCLSEVDFAETQELHFMLANPLCVFDRIVASEPRSSNTPPWTGQRCSGR